MDTHTSHIEKKMDKISIIALFAAFSLFLSSIEYLLPRPIPFFRYGLANIAMLLIIRTFCFRDVCLLGILKVLGLGILNGTFASYVFIFSLFGTMASLLVMYTVSSLFKTHVSITGISISGAFASNVVQIACAVLFVFGTQSWIIAPYLLLLGVSSGIGIGLLAQYYWNNSLLLHNLLHQYKEEIHRAR